ncbi:hypothetical protein F5Y15DRAFT_268197 [Xylariaceae sp. FL0016]|nr:hypothetical protein F5Y15DRAFT_268197 [Xylariaceae sp. FL0016]
MRFLCFHGRGTNARIFEQQTARIREALGREHEFVFIDGPVAASPAVGLEKGDDHYFQWVGGDWNQRHELYKDLIDFIESQGPFDSLMAFSEGGSVAAQMLIEDSCHHFGNFKCAVFFSAPIPLDPELVARGIIVEASRPAALAGIPTAHIWSEAGEIYPGAGREWVSCCDADMREEVVHNLGHEVPGSVTEEGFSQTLRAIERTIERAKALGHMQ